MDRERVVLAEIIRPRGVRGELLAISQTDVPGRLEELKRAQVRMADGADVEVEISRVWPYRGDWVLKFAGVDSMDEAQRFRGADLWVPFAERASLPEGEHFQTDLIGCLVVDERSGQELGVVTALHQYGGPPLLGVGMGEREVLIPYVPEICRTINVDERVIRVQLPDGLLEL